MIRSLATTLGFLILSQVAGNAAKPVDAVTFAVEPGGIFVPLDEAAKRLRWRASHDADTGQWQLGKQTVDKKYLRQLVDGTQLINLACLEDLGATLQVSEDGRTTGVRSGRRTFAVAANSKRVEVNLAEQRLCAWQGGRLVLDCRISSGRGRSTPAGNFRAGPYKARRHYSSRYNNAPMPWSVQVNGHIFIHGFTSVPDYPASHGCIRLPLDEGNPAKFFYEWIDVGTPIQITAKDTKSE